MFGYRKRLKGDLAEWRKKGFIEADGAEAILKDLDSRGMGLGLAPILAILAAVLLSFAAMTFVAANWQEMSKLSRILLLFTALGGAYFCAWMFKERGMAFFSEASILLGCGLFGANIMLIAQMYHMEGNPPDAVLLWAAGSLLAAGLLRSNSALALSIILFTLWTVMEGELRGMVHLGYILAWAAMAAFAYRARWRPSYHLLLIGALIWIFHSMLSLRIDHEYLIVTGLGLGLCALATYGKDWIDRLLDFSRPLFYYGMVIAFLGAFGWQFFENRELTALVLIAAAVLGTILASIFYGLRLGDNMILWLGYAGFSIEILALYFKTLDTLQNTSLFFLIAGLIVSALAYFAWRLHQAQLDGDIGGEAG